MAMVKLLEYTFDNTIDVNCLPAFSGVGATEVIDSVSGNTTTRIINVEETRLPTKISFSMKTALTKVLYMNTDNVNTMQEIFLNCTNLTLVNSSNWNTSRVTTMFQGFKGCSKLVSLDTSNWDVSKVTNMQSMFSGCSLMTSLDLSNFDTSLATNMQEMFNGCSKMNVLDLSNFDMSNVTNTTNMFKNTTSLNNIGLLYSDSATINKITPLLPTTTSKKIHYVDANLGQLTAVNNVNFVEYKTNILSCNEDVELGSVGEVKDELNLLTGQLTQRTETRAYQEGDEVNSEVITDMTNTRYKLPKESVKTVDLNGQKVYSYDGTTHYSCSAAEGSLIPTLAIDVPTNLPALVSRQRVTIESQKEQIITLEQENEQLIAQNEVQDIDISLNQDAINFMLFAPATMALAEHTKGVNTMAAYLANQILKGRLDYTLVVGRYGEFKEDIDTILISEGKQDLIK